MIEWLHYTKTANFYQRRRRLTKRAISELFRTLRSRATDPSRSLFYHVREEHRGAVWSAIAFFHAREPSFLELPPDHIRERICGFILLIEYKQHVAVLKSGLDVPASFRNAYLGPIGAEKVESATARANVTFEQIRLRNMGVSKYAMRSKTLEADDLSSVLSPSGSNRYIPAGFRTRDADLHLSATPSTGRIAVRSERAGYSELIDWAKQVIDRLTDRAVDLSPFIRNFARPISLSAVTRDLRPTSVAIDVAALASSLYEDSAAIRFVKMQDTQLVALTHAEITSVLDVLANTFTVRPVRRELRIIDPRDNAVIGELRIGKTRISLRRFGLPEAEGVMVEHLNGLGEAIPLKRYLDRDNLFTVLFNMLDVVYINGDLFKDPSLSDGGERFLSYIHANSALEQTTSEKGTFTQAHTVFDADSVFAAVVSNLSPASEVLACDDLGDEWADFIGVNSAAQPKTVTFYHAKHGEPSLSASAFHASVGQAIKNLQHLRMTPESLERKRLKWEGTYNNSGSETQILRMVKGSFAEMQEAVQETVVSPDTIRRVLLLLTRSAAESSPGLS